MNFRTRLTFFLLSPTLLLAGCQKENAFDCFKSTGSIETENRELPTFRTIRVFDNLKVSIVADTINFVEVKAGDHLLGNILTEVKNGELWIQNINKCNWVRSYHKPMEVRLHAREVFTIFHEGDATISSEGLLPADTLFLHLNSAGDMDFELNTQVVWLDMYELGDVYLKGKNQNLDGYVLSSGTLYATGLQSQNVSLKLTDQGSAKVNAVKRLTANISGNGNIYYVEQPAELSRTGEGAGKVLKAE